MSAVTLGGLIFGAYLGLSLVVQSVSQSLRKKVGGLRGCENQA